MSDEYQTLKATFDKWRAMQEESSSRSITVFLSTRKPLRLNYEIGTFNTEREFAITKEEKVRLEEKLQVFEGMYSTFSFGAFGIAQIGNEAFNAQLTINDLDSADYITHAKEGNIGDGHLSGGELLFRLHISPSMVRDILTFQTTFKRFAALDANASTDMLLTSGGDYSLSPLYGYDQSLGVPKPFLILRLQIELKESLSQEAKGIGYWIKYLYM
jgi:hypothetical protein